MKQTLCGIFLSLLAFSPCYAKESIPCEATENAFRQALELSRKSQGKREIVIADGILRLTSPIVLDARDSGLTLRSSGKTVISGGIPLSFTPVPGKPYWSAKIPKGLPEPRLLASSNGNIPVAAYPRQGMLEYQETTDLLWLGSQYGGWDRPPKEEELNRITANPAELPPFSPEDAECYVPHSWDASLVQVKSVDRTTGLILFANKMRRPAGSFQKQQYQLRNIEAGLLPGTWMQHRATGEIFYYPQVGQNIGSVQLNAAILHRLLTITDATGITVENLTFSDCNATPASDPSLPLNDPKSVSSAIRLADTDGITFSHIVVRNCYGSGITTDNSTVNNNLQIQNSRIFAIGKNGIHIITDGISSIQNCEIRDIDNIGIWAGIPQGTPLRVTGNRICGTGYCGITCHGVPRKSTWNESALVAENDISRAMQNLDMHDGAAIYLFRANQWKITRNTIHDMPGSGLRHGIYFDEMSRHCIATDNTVSCFFPVMVHKAKDILCENCTFEHSGPMKFDLVTSDDITFKNCRISAPEILFSAPKDSLKTLNCTVEGKVTENVKKRNFSFATDDSGVLRCTILPPKQKTRRLPHRIVCLGDSITAAGTFAGELQLYLSCRYPQEKIQVFNAGVNGDSAAGGFQRLDRDVLSLNPDMVIVCFGMNDVGNALYKTKFPADEKEAEAREKGFRSYCENMQKITETLADRGIEVVVMAPFPYDEYGTRPEPDKKYPYANSIGLERLATHCYGTYSPKYLFPMSRMMLCRLYAWFPELQVARDRVHPNRFGHWVTANEIAKTVFADIPATRPLPFPMTREMADFANIGKGKKYQEDVSFTPLDTLVANGQIDGETAPLRTQMEAVLTAEGLLRQLKYYDNILRQKGIDPADTAKADPVLTDFARRWHLTSDVQKYFQARNERDRLQQNAQKEKDAYFALVESITKQLQKSSFSRDRQ